MYFLIKLDLETDINIVKYKYPNWLTDELKAKIINLSNTMPADSFVDVVIETDIEEEKELILNNGGKELSQAEFEVWKNAKLLILSLMAKEEPITEDDDVNTD